MANPEHVAKLKEGVEAWNGWRKANPDVVPDLTRENLSNVEGSDFFGVHLRGADFVGAHLKGAKLRGAQLEEANFGGARLEEANFGGAHLEEANFRGALLERANLRRAHLKRADFQGAHLEEASLQGAQLERAKLWGAHLEGAGFQGAHLEGADFWEAHLKGAGFRGAYLKGADLQSTDLSNADLRDTSGIRFDDTRILHARLTPQPGTFGQRLLPWFILNPRTDPWSTLRRAYTGANFFIALVALIALLLPFVFQLTAWRGVNEVQSIMRNAAAALKPPLESGLSEFEARAATIRERAQHVPFADATAWLAVPEWLLFAVTAVSELKPCLAAECRSVPVWQLLIGFHRGTALALLSLSVLLYGVLRWYLTTAVSAYREEEERSGYTPAWSPESRELKESPRGWLPPQLHSFTELVEKNGQVRRLRRAIAGYEHLVWLHIFLRCLVLVVSVTGLVNWLGFLSLPVEIPAR